MNTRLFVKTDILLFSIAAAFCSTAGADNDVRLIASFRGGPAIVAGVDLGVSFAKGDAIRSNRESQFRIRGEVDWRGFGGGIGVGRAITSGDEVFGIAALEVRLFYPWITTTFPHELFIGPEISSTWIFVAGGFCSVLWSVQSIGGEHDRIATCGYRLGYN
jgi:hypothetical protein